MIIDGKEENGTFESKENRGSESTAWTGTEERDCFQIDTVFSSLDSLRKQVENVWDSYVDQPNITPEMIRKVVDWLFGIFWRRDMNSQTIFLCLGLVRVYLRNTIIQKSELQCVALSALLIASKFLEVRRLDMSSILQLCQQKYTKDDIVEMQFNILTIVNFNLDLPTLDKYLQVYQKVNTLTSDQQVKASFWLESLILSDLMSDENQKQNFLDVISFVTDSSSKSSWMSKLISFTKQGTFKYVCNKSKSLFDVEEYLSILY